MVQWTVLVIGSGGREHALANRLLECESVARVIVNPGNGGMRVGGPGVSAVAGDPIEVALASKPDLVVIGPEQPLCEGLADELGARGFVVYGPSRRAAELEGSKSFMKDFAARHGVRTAGYQRVNRLEDLDGALGAFASPPVVKASGLCAGKGVVVAESFVEAESAARSMLGGAAFGEAGKTVVLEERLFGQEVSVHAICDGEQAWVLPPIQDHKRIGEGDTGPNTGGMGTYGPAPVVTKDLYAGIERDVIGPLVRGMAQEGAPFRGTLFANMMVSSVGDASLLEVNVRFGDPETQVLMNLIDGDLARLLHSAASGNLDTSAVAQNGRHGLCVVLAAAGYPGDVRRGDPIEGIAAAEATSGVRVYHAGTRREGDRILTSGGRVLGVTATANRFEDAHALAYAACECIRFDGMQYRRDIGRSAFANAPAR